MSARGHATTRVYLRRLIAIAGSMGRQLSPWLFPILSRFSRYCSAVFELVGDYSMSFIGSRGRTAACAPGAIAYSVSWHWRGALVLLLASAMMTPAFGKGSSTPPGHRHTPPHRSASSEGKHHTHGSVHKGERPELAAKSRILPDRASAHEAAATLEPSADLTATKQAIALLRHRKFSEAAALAATIDDPMRRTLHEG